MVRYIDKHTFKRNLFSREIIYNEHDLVCLLNKRPTFYASAIKISNMAQTVNTVNPCEGSLFALFHSQLQLLLDTL